MNKKRKVIVKSMRKETLNKERCSYLKMKKKWYNFCKKKIIVMNDVRVFCKIHQSDPDP